MEAQGRDSPVCFPILVQYCLNSIWQPVLVSVWYEEWCHIVDEACFAPNGGQLKMFKYLLSFPGRFLSKWSLSIEEMWEMFLKMKIYLYFQSLSWLKIRV